MSDKKNKFEISAQTRNVEFELPAGSYSVSKIRDYIEHVFLKEHETGTDYIREQNRK